MPPIDAEADAWTQEALRLTSFPFWPHQRDYPRAVQLWTQAAARNHWKAMMNLASTLATGNSGRAHVPDGLALPTEPQHTSAPRYESTKAGLDGYWLPQLLHPSSDRHAAWNAAQFPLRYAAHETFEPAREGLVEADGRIVFHYLGQPVEAPVVTPSEHPAAARTIARAVPMPTPYVTRRGDEAASRSAVWLARVDNDHPHALTFNHWLRQRYLSAGQTFPALLDAPVLEPSDITWYCCGQSNGQSSPGWTWVRLNDTDLFER